MRIKKNFILRKIGGENYAVPLGEMAASFRGMIRMNETGAFYWRELEKGITREELVERSLERFEDLDRETAERDLDEYLNAISFALEDE